MLVYLTSYSVLCKVEDTGDSNKAQVKLTSLIKRINNHKLCRPNGALCLTALKPSTENCWFSQVSIGHIKLGIPVPCHHCTLPYDETSWDKQLLYKSLNEINCNNSQVDETLIIQHIGYQSLLEVHTCKRSEKFCDLTSVVLNQQYLTHINETVGHNTCSDLKKHK